MQIEVGKTYVESSGEKVTIQRKEPDARCPFIGDNCQSYHEDGMYDHEQGKTVLDLIAEWSEPADADSWITWAGGECPVPSGRCVDTLRRNGEKLNDTISQTPSYVRLWRNNGEPWDIVAYRVTPDADGWITWAGAEEAPVPADKIVEVRFRDGVEGYRGPVRSHRWSHFDVNSDIIAYRVVQPAETPKVGDTLRLKRNMLDCDNAWTEGIESKVTEVDDEGRVVVRHPTRTSLLYRLAFWPHEDWGLVTPLPVTIEPDSAPTAPTILQRAAQHLLDRAAAYDAPAGERSMARTVAVFNALHGTTLSEAQGWSFMAVLKQVRAFQSGGLHLDSVEDGAAYLALLGEAQARG